MDVNEQLAVIKGKMPGVYAAIQDKAKELPGAFGLVRRGLRGEANCFYACERGHVVGTPFSAGVLATEAAARMVQFGCAWLCMWPDGVDLLTTTVVDPTKALEVINGPH